MAVGVAPECQELPMPMRLGLWSLKQREDADGREQESSNAVL